MFIVCWSLGFILYLDSLFYLIYDEFFSKMVTNNYYKVFQDNCIIFYVFNIVTTLQGGKNGPVSYGTGSILL